MIVDPKTMRFAGRLTSAVMAKMLFMYGGYQAGVWADGRLGTAPLFMALGLFLTFGLGLAFLLRVLARIR